ncbi:hypothetical protein CRV02_08290 [Arcobacter sp. CECT 8989]|uniref:cell wall metabolism sensor histidine kinase WalK n=1 Tax=Arcobacter sp. CECT 8989 TaxID=2044509 RepID=UPI0010283AD5|nr:cell wall metabolism sensor histidine kinase WalK [Arcobacter sp. CECT 8989]RXK01498.1 hypothetical protein CRV02_08290 [Arcobacter sp. CECT 8989]
MESIKTLILIIFAFTTSITLTVSGVYFLNENLKSNVENNITSSKNNQSKNESKNQIKKIEKIQNKKNENVTKKETEIKNLKTNNESKEKEEEFKRIKKQIDEKMNYIFSNYNAFGNGNLTITIDSNDKVKVESSNLTNDRKLKQNVYLSSKELEDSIENILSFRKYKESFILDYDLSIKNIGSIERTDYFSY